MRAAVDRFAGTRARAGRGRGQSLLRADLEDDAEARFVAQHALVRVLRLLQWKDFVPRGHAGQRAEGEGFLRVLGGAARPPLDPPACPDELERADLDGLRTGPGDDQRTVAGGAVAQP